MAIECQPVALIPEQPERSLVQSDKIPQALMASPQWVCWRYVDRGQGRKPDKQPVNPHTLHNAGVNWPNTWSQFDTAYQAYITQRKHGIQGVGFMLTLDDPYVAVDLDSCIDENRIAERASEIITTLNSYTEVSPSGQGIRILLACPDFRNNLRRPQLELYSHARYVTITGQHLLGTPAQIAAIPFDQLSSLFPKPVIEPQTPQAVLPELHRPALGDQELWERIFAHDRLGTQHLHRFQGDLSLDGGDHSFTVIRLLNCLARWTYCDPVRMRTMMLLSPLANEKWVERRGRGDWLDHQIADAIAYISGKRQS